MKRKTTLPKPLAKIVAAREELFALLKKLNTGEITPAAARKRNREIQQEIGKPKKRKRRK